MIAEHDLWLVDKQLVSCQEREREAVMRIEQGLDLACAQATVTDRVYATIESACVDCLIFFFSSAFLLPSTLQFEMR